MSKYEPYSSLRQYHREMSGAQWDSKPQFWNGPKPWEDTTLVGLPPLLSNQEETARFFNTPIKMQVREILRENKGRPWPPFIEGTPLGNYPGPRRGTLTPPPGIALAFKYQAIVRHCNNAIQTLRDRRLGLAKHLSYLVLWETYENLINTWRRKQ